ncbi:MAG: nitrilase-related carbon-nitrogen hydrolase [Planctomycetota bacterium]|nr:nitrilase-related carbon-nitrogen hydrolase [Planctomycetota bacterium]
MKLLASYRSLAAALILLSVAIAPALLTPATANEPAKANSKPSKLKNRKPDQPLIVAAVSCRSTIREVNENLDRIEHWAREAAKQNADIALFPESGITAWWQSRENRKYAQPVDGPAIKRIAKLAKELDMILAVGLTELDGKSAYITHVIVGPEGVIGTHRKSSLAGGKDNGESRTWEQGNDANVFDLLGYKVGVAICFESVHPETCAKLRDKGAEIILAPYANGTKPSEITDAERKERSWVWKRVDENKVWYIACDGAPRNEKGERSGGAAYVIDPTGKLVTISPNEGPGEAMVVVNVTRDSIVPASGKAK